MDVKKIAAKYGVSALLLFGSRAKNELLHQESDFDIAYIADEGLGLINEAKLINDLMSYLKTDKVDLVNLKRAPPLLRINVMRGYQVLYKKSGFSLTPLEVYAEKLYIENMPLFKAKSEYLDKVLKH